MSSTLHPLHDWRDRECVALLSSGWELRQFRETDSRRDYFAKKGFGHVQLWHAETGTSIVTPSRLTGGEFELHVFGERYSARLWKTIARGLVARDIATPLASELRAVERWFVLAPETAAGRLLRSWWAGAAESAR